MINVLIVDDESAARSALRSLLELEPDFQVIGEGADAGKAVELIDCLKPDALFLDVQMPGLTGLELLRKNSSGKLPYTVIVSAYDRYALQAFEVHVMDYLLKPVSSMRFNESLLRLRRYVELDRRAEGKFDMDELLRQLKPQPTSHSALIVSERIPVKIGRRIRFFSLKHIGHLIADGNYVNMHMTTGEVIHTSERISQMEEKLIAHSFIRIHRSIILNIDQIREIHSTGSTYEFTMLDGKEMASGITYKMNIQNLVARWKKNHATLVV